MGFCTLWKTVTQVKTLPCKAKAEQEQHPETPPTTPGPSDGLKPKFDESTYQIVFWAIRDIVSSGRKRRMTINIVTSAKFKCQYL